MKKYLLLSAFVFPLSLWAQYLLPNEEIIYSFETKNGKKMTLVKDKKEAYIQYRFGSKNHVEMEFPSERTEESWKKFKYNSYYRGGGKQNAGMSLNYLTFTNNGYQYQIFKTYQAEDESYSTGVTVTDAKGKETDIDGIYKTIKGCLCRLDDSHLILKEDTGL
ncbi:hypothetical protein ACVVIH_14015 [Chryseobacterium arthrosphaerae]|uniref:hypothetical protein n=1 Tax=Chryseobacterium arthrosphaerae TaxID=651561 RepID=UPI001BAECC36|nr:hypothetical protein [Chryseobacterium arthrosphaerae]QUY54854.1 hypothetical protein I2F65_18540 [Chryseobacterium arthrosphaerae]WES96001.1 hypothetical protein P2W68_14190 [Chryseobacterium arthrosphaerae]